MERRRNKVMGGTKALAKVHSSAHHLQICWRNELWGETVCHRSAVESLEKKTGPQKRRCFHLYAKNTQKQTKGMGKERKEKRRKVEQASSDINKTDLPEKKIGVPLQ